MVSYSSKTLTPKKILDFNCSLKSRWLTLFLWQLHIAAGGSCLKHWDKCPKRCNIITLKCTWCPCLSADLKKEPNKSNPDDCSFSSLLAFILAFMSVTHTHLCFLIAFLEWRTFFELQWNQDLQKHSNSTGRKNHLSQADLIIFAVSFLLFTVFPPSLRSVYSSSHCFPLETGAADLWSQSSRQH